MKNTLERLPKELQGKSVSREKLDRKKRRVNQKENHRTLACE
jgi:hypothetical protein